jgi:hypothetical protein
MPAFYSPPVSADYDPGPSSGMPAFYSPPVSADTNKRRRRPVQHADATYASHASHAASTVAMQPFRGHLNVGNFSPSKPWAQTSSAITDDHDASEGFGDDEGMPDRGEFLLPNKRKKVSRKRRVPPRWRPDYREVLCSYCVNNAPKNGTGHDGASLTCDNGACTDTAAVWCRTCDRTLCCACDVAAHSGQTCNPTPHLRETVSTGIELGPKEAAPTREGLAAVIPDVFLACAATCQVCGDRSWTVCSDVRVRGLTVVTTSGKFTIDRVSYECTKCGNKADAGDPMTYLTKSTIPASLARVETIFTHDIVSFMHRLQRVAPGVSDTAMAAALSSSECRVRSEHVSTVVGILEDIHAALAASAAGNTGHTDMTEYARAVAEAGNRRSVGSDMTLKVRLKQSTTRKETLRQAESGEPEDNLSRPEVIPDSVMRDFRLLDPRQTTCRDTCDREFVATKATVIGDARSGLVVAVDANGAPVISVIPLHGDGERYIYHFIVLIAARFAGHYAYCSIDIACKFKSWLDRVGSKAAAVQAQLKSAASAARANEASLRRELSSASVAGCGTAGWLQPYLTALHELFKRDNMTDGNACREAAAVMTALVYLLEVHAGVDVDITDPAEWPDVHQVGFAVVLDAMHAYAHGWHCRLTFDPRAQKKSGRQCGEQVERYNSVVLAYASRMASSGTETGKHTIALNMRAQQDAKFEGAAGEVKRSITASAQMLDELALELCHRSRQLLDSVSIRAEDKERAARTNLTASAMNAHEAGNGTPSQRARTWAMDPTTVTNCEVVERGIIERILDDSRTTPRAKQMQALLAMCMVAKTEKELAIVVGAIDKVTGEDSLAAGAVRLAMQDVTKLNLPATAPEFAGRTDGTVAMKGLKEALQKIGMPDNVIDAGFPSGGGVNAIDSVTLCSWIAIRMSMDEAGKLAAAIRERKILVFGQHGNGSGTHRARGGAGSQRRTPEYKLLATRLKARAKELWGWVRKYNALAAGLAESVAKWKDRSTRSQGVPAMHLEVHELPPQMSEAQVRDPGWVPAHSGVAKCSVADTAFVDALRSYRTHLEEATHVGTANAEALVGVLANLHAAIAARINDGLNPVLSAPQIKTAPELPVALACSFRLHAVSRHCPRSTLLPQVMLSSLLEDRGAAPVDAMVDPNDVSDVHIRCLLAGWRALLLQRLHQVSLLWESARTTLRDHLPAVQATLTGGPLVLPSSAFAPATHPQRPEEGERAAPPEATVLPTLERASSGLSSSAPTEGATQRGGTRAKPSALPPARRALQLTNNSSGSESGGTSTSDTSAASVGDEVE